MVSLTEGLKPAVRLDANFFLFFSVFFKTNKMFNLKQITKYLGTLLSFHFCKMIELIGVSGNSIRFRRPGVCQSPDTVNCLTLGKSFDPGQVEVPHL